MPCGPLQSATEGGHGIELLFFEVFAERRNDPGIGLAGERNQDPVGTALQARGGGSGITVDRCGSGRGHHDAIEKHQLRRTVARRPRFGRLRVLKIDPHRLGGPLQLNGVRYANGIGAQARSRIEFALGGRWDRFFVLAGIDDAASREGQAIFRVYGDGKLLKEITRRRGDRPAAMSLDVKGVDRIVLEALPGDSYTSDLCDWAEARVYQNK